MSKKNVPIPHKHSRHPVRIVKVEYWIQCYLIIVYLDGSFEQAQGNARQLRIRVKREKVSLQNEEKVENDASSQATFKGPPLVPQPIRVDIDYD